MSAFDDMDRTDIEPASHLISRADYLNASARPEAASVRAFVDRLIEQYPASDRDGLIRRLRSRDNNRHRSAWFELLLHGLMVARGFTIIAVESELAGGRAPDFLVGVPDGREFFLEATVAEGETGANPGADRRLRDVLQAVDGVQSQDFSSACITVARRPSRSVSGVCAARCNGSSMGWTTMRWSPASRPVDPRRSSGLRSTV